ncbi:phosphoenolpyruvate--protein phosphotransferase [Rhizobium straminoryzae]|uniref:Phosphoenolpyruvate-protein phosphotransferase n=1 Tax=Rhizobium straminoryzae TaxID=1387186 RepID=A0A549TFE1_9HYPH|nr:phosphoenolpyruvate--protein phosphotransferase [Rhizobium straminoryzae]TRL41242.1 phosphoenolpyruvate--protein phosphotransferase [Rhizobium straminoryzae]
MEIQRAVRVAVPGGIHARPAAEIVRLSKGYNSELFLEHQGKSATTRSSFKLILLSLKEGADVTIRAIGEDADRAVEDIAGYLEARQGDHAQGAAASPEAKPDPTGSGDGTAPAGALSGNALKGVAGGSGAAIGPAFAFRQPVLEPFAALVADVDADIRAAREAMQHVGLALRRQAAAASRGTADVLNAIAELSDDAEWSARVEALIRGGRSAGAAVLAVGAELADELSALEDSYARARSEDIASLTRLTALHLQGKHALSLADVPAGSVLVADEISAAEAGGADLSRLSGIVTRQGSASSHAAILARAAGVPAVFGVQDPDRRLDRAREIALDGDGGLVFPDPDARARDDIVRRCEMAKAEAQALRTWIDVAPTTTDGVAITIAANLGSVDEIAQAQAAGAMGVGLFRTEFLFMNRNDLPTEDEQLDVYKSLLLAFPDHPVIIRTLDIGADKPVRSLALSREDNPFLGVRGIRLCLARPDLFKPQLRALLRAAPFGRLHVMLPMVADTGEIDATRALIDQCRSELIQEGKTAADFVLGIMVETPAAVFAAETLARKVRFFSIGTNDLTQYVMAADRLNPGVAELCRVDQPAVLSAIRMVCTAAEKAGIWVGVCGEAAGDAAVAQHFIAAGVTELSMAPASILKMKSAVSGYIRG